MECPVSNLRIREEKVLVTPRTLIEKFPITGEVSLKIRESREVVNNIIKGQDKRLLAIVGPCSINDSASALDYAYRLKELAASVGDRIFVIMRTYFEKPRTSIGWKGLVMDPDMDESCDIEKGLEIARSLLIKINSLGLPVGGEVLEPFIPQYVDDLLSWVSIGARTAESQVHRSLASGLSPAVGFKNGTSGEIDGAVNAIKAAAYPASFIGINKDGQSTIVRTTGNDCCHLILRGGKQAPNYFEDDVQRASVFMKKTGVNNSIIVDCSHDNSRKDPQRQKEVLSCVLDQVCWGQKAIKGFMIESFLHEGSQQPDSKNKVYGVSVTDACLGWEDTRNLIEDAAKRLRSCK